jgi:hypothetical protein
MSASLQTKGDLLDCSLPGDPLEGVARPHQRRGQPVTVRRSVRAVPPPDAEAALRDRMSGTRVAFDQAPVFSVKEKPAARRAVGARRQLKPHGSPPGCSRSPRERRPEPRPPDLSWGPRPSAASTCQTPFLRQRANHESSSVFRTAARRAPPPASEPRSRSSTPLLADTGRSSGLRAMSCRTGDDRREQGREGTAMPRPGAVLRAPDSVFRRRPPRKTADALGSPDRSSDVVPVSRANRRGQVPASQGDAGESRKNPQPGWRSPPRVLLKVITSFVKSITKGRASRASSAVRGPSHRDGQTGLAGDEAVT